MDPFFEKYPEIERHYKLIEKQKAAYKRGDYKRAIKYCSEDIESYPAFKNAHYAYELNFINRGVLPDQGITEPFYPAFLMLAKIYDKQGLFDKAIQVCDLAITYNLDDGTKGGFEGRKLKLIKKQSENKPVKIATLAEEIELKQNKVALAEKTAKLMPDSVKSWGWNIAVSFGDSSSSNFEKALYLVKSAPAYVADDFSGKKIYQAFYSSKAADYLAFIMLYELVSSWKSTVVTINGAFVDRKIVSGINYCYGDKCRSGSSRFCFGASFMTANPFGCHRLQISASNNPWWGFSTKNGNQYLVNKGQIKQRALEYGAQYSLCPSYDERYTLMKIDELPNMLTKEQYNIVANGGELKLGTTTPKMVNTSSMPRINREPKKRHRHENEKTGMLSRLLKFFSRLG